MDVKYIQRHLDKLYAELAQLKRYVIIHTSVEKRQNDSVWRDLDEACKEISALWKGPNAVEEIRAHREN